MWFLSVQWILTDTEWNFFNLMKDKHEKHTMNIRLKECMPKMKTTLKMVTHTTSISYISAAPTQ
jgi:hypothetical protein